MRRAGIWGMGDDVGRTAWAVAGGVRRPAPLSCRRGRFITPGGSVADMNVVLGLFESRLWRLWARVLILLFWAFPLMCWGLIGILIVLARTGGNSFLPFFAAFSLMSGAVLSAVAVWMVLSPAPDRTGALVGDAGEYEVYQAVPAADASVFHGIAGGLLPPDGDAARGQGGGGRAGR